MGALYYVLTIEVKRRLRMESVVNGAAVCSRMGEGNVGLLQDDGIFMFGLAGGKVAKGDSVILGDSGLGGEKNWCCSEHSVSNLAT